MVKPNLCFQVILALLLASGLRCPGHAAEDSPLSKAQASLSKADYVTALTLLKPLASNGSVEAQYKLGLMYEQGQGVPSDFRQALFWIQKAAQQGFPAAEGKLAEFYEQGLGGLPEDLEQAIGWYKKAADQGDADAAFGLSGIYCNRPNFKSDKNLKKQFLYWMEKSAQLGLREAQADLGDIYFGGRGIAADWPKALKWNTLAAERGDGPAIFRAGRIYDGGLGVPRDYKQAAKWFMRGALAGDGMCRSRLAEMYTLGQGVPKDLKEAERWRRTIKGNPGDLDKELFPAGAGQYR